MIKFHIVYAFYVMVGRGGIEPPSAVYYHYSSNVN